MAAIGLSMAPALKTDYAMHDDQDVVTCLNTLLSNAINQHASDIHIEPFAEYCQIRYRKNGLLHAVNTFTNVFAIRIVTRLKIMAALNIAEKRLPQDGRILFKKNGNIDIRLSTCPTLYGEKIVLRLLNTATMPLSIDKLGMTGQQQQIFIHALQQPYGLILISGPTGSGKTVTLYSALNYLKHSERNIITIEDPVEIELNGVNQVNVNSRIGLTFPTLLRTILRQDPDIIMVGEIRDAETALIAMQAAQTGHLVLSSVHANNAESVMSRLNAMDIPAHYLTNSLWLIVAQRLIGAPHGGRVGVFECVPFEPFETRTACAPQGERGWR